MKNVSLKTLAIPVAATALTVAVVANAAITPAFPTVSETFAVDGEIIHAADVNKLAEGINNLDQRSWIEGAGYMSAPNAVDGVVVTDDGKVGIGTETPSDTLTVEGGMVRIDNDKAYIVTGAGYIGSRDAETSALSGNNLSVSSNDAIELAAGVNTSNIPDVFIEGNGNVGIGTQSPSAKLHLKDSTKEQLLLTGYSKYGTVNVSDLNGEIKFGNSATNFANISYDGQQSGVLHIDNGWDNAQGDILFSTRTSGTPVDAMIIEANGNVGIGTTSPSTKLHVAGTITEDSDERLKENVQTVENSLEKITQINGVSFDWIDEEKYGDDTTYGILAQEVEAVFPELVYTAEDEMGTKSVNYDGLVAPLIEAVKEQQAQIETQQSQIDVLVLEIEELKNAQ